MGKEMGNEFEKEYVNDRLIHQPTDGLTLWVTDCRLGDKWAMSWAMKWMKRMYKKASGKWNNSITKERTNERANEQTMIEMGVYHVYNVLENKSNVF